MHDLKWIRENPEAFDAALKRRNLSGEAGRLIAIDERRRAVILKLAPDLPHAGPIAHPEMPLRNGTQPQPVQTEQHPGIELAKLGTKLRGSI